MSTLEKIQHIALQRWEDLRTQFVAEVVCFFSLDKFVWKDELASFPGPARLSLAVRNLHRGPGLIHHVMCAAAYVTAISLRINDVIGWTSMAFYIEEASKDHSGGLYASLANCYRDSKAVILSWI